MLSCRYKALVAVAAVALAARGSLAGNSLLDEELLMEEMKGEGPSSLSSASSGKFSSAATELNLDEGYDGGEESLHVLVARVQGMDETELKLRLRSMYSVSKDAQAKQIYPAGSLEAMQEKLNELSSLDEEQRDLDQFMQRYAFLLGRVLNCYTDFFGVKVNLGRPELTPEEYMEEVKKLPVQAGKWKQASELLVKYLELGARDLRDKWDQAVETDRRLKGVLGYIEKLREVYEAQQRLFRAGYALALMRYMKYPDRQADLALLMEDPGQKQALNDYEDALENIKEKTHQARKAAAKNVREGFLAEGYLTLLPFPEDKQRAMDDLVNEEM